jgi:hypothetical protein
LSSCGLVFAGHTRFVAVLATTPAVAATIRYTSAVSWFPHISCETIRFVFVIFVELHSARRNHRKMIWAQPFTRRTPAFDTILGEEGLESFAEVEDGRAEGRTQCWVNFERYERWQAVVDKNQTVASFSRHPEMM